MVDDLGPVVFRGRVEERLGRRLADGAAPPAPAEGDHAGVHPQKQPGLFYAGFPVHLGLMNGEQMIGLADLAASFGGGIRLTRRQNFILTDIPADRLDAALAGAAALGFPIGAGALRGLSHRLHRRPLLQLHRRRDQGEAAGDRRPPRGRAGARRRRISSSTSTAARTPAPITGSGTSGCRGRRCASAARRARSLHGYDLFLRGGLGAGAAIGRPVLRRVPGDEVHRVIERLFRAYLERRGEGEPIQRFFARTSDEDLAGIAGVAMAGAAAAAAD